MAVYDINGNVIETQKTSRYAGKKLSIIGDSIDTFNQEGYKIDGYAMWYPRGSITDVEQTWWKKVINDSGMSLEINASFSGSRVTNTAPDSSFPDFYDRVPVIGNPDIIFVTLGTNDSNNNVDLGEYDFDTTYTSLSESTFRTAYIKGVKALQATYPDAQIVCISERMKDAYKESIIHIADVLGVTFIDASDYVGESGSHPGEYGMRQIASTVLYPTDTSFTQNKISADAEAVGKALADVIDKALTQEVKDALLACFRGVAWLNWKDEGKSLYNNLYDALYNSDSRIMYEIPHGTDISDWSIDTEQHAYTLDEDFTILANVTTNTAGAEATGMFLLDSQSANTPTVGVRIQANISNGYLTFRNAFNGGSGSSGGSGGSTTGSYSADTNHNIIFILRNASKALTAMTYVDGVLDYQSTDTLAEKQNTYPSTYYIGKNHSDVVRPWFGNVNMFRIYNTALSNAEIGNLLNVTI